MIHSESKRRAHNYNHINYNETIWELNSKTVRGLNKHRVTGKVKILIRGGGGIGLILISAGEGWNFVIKSFTLTIKGAISGYPGLKWRSTSTQSLPALYG